MENFQRKWLYHKTEGAKLVESKEEHDALKGDWKEVPFAVDQEQISPIEKQEASAHVPEEQKQESGSEEKLVLVHKKARKHKGEA